jgi:formylglycine-generating enzyme required for sulfatase activity
MPEYSPREDHEMTRFACAATMAAVMACGTPPRFTPAGAAGGPSPVNTSTVPTSASTLVAPPAGPSSLDPTQQRPSGSFTMGSEDGHDDEKPVHPVTVGPFQMDPTEVTVAQYRACVLAGACVAENLVSSGYSRYSAYYAKWSEEACNYDKPKRDPHPMNCVDWQQATNFCAWAGKRLPTEEQWECAARGAGMRAYPWGNEPPDERRVNACGPECLDWAQDVMKVDWFRQLYAVRDSWTTTAPVGSYPLGDTPSGLHDMAGNVAEWTSSPYCSSYAAGAPCTTGRVVRGGSWSSGVAGNLRTTTRTPYDPLGRHVDLGFRCAK